MDKKLNKVRTRPRFKIYSDFEISDFEKNLKKNLLKHPEIKGNINKEVASIWVKTQHNEFWKPYLSLRIEKEDNKTAIRGVFGPSSAVWTFFMFLYFLFSVNFMVFISIWWVTKQINSPDFPWAIYAAFASIILLIITYVATKIGQIKAKNEMIQLKKLIDEIIPNS